MKNINENLSLEDARNAVNLYPTDGQIKAGNYSKGHIYVQGMPITIENPKGSYRRGVDENGKPWQTMLYNDYGYFNHTLGKDGDQIDVFLGDDLGFPRVYVVDQVINNKFDESKVMLGFVSQEQARIAYLSNYEKGWNGLGAITEVDMDTFKKWLYDGCRQRKAFSSYKELDECEAPFSFNELLNEDKNMKKNLSESQLRNIISESIRQYLSENLDRFGIDADNYNYDDIFDEYDKEEQIDDLYDNYGNKSQVLDRAAEEMYCDGEDECDSPGFLSMAAQGGNPENVDKDVEDMHNDPLNGEHINNLLHDMNARTAQDPAFWASKKSGVYHDEDLYEAVSKAIKRILK